MTLDGYHSMIICDHSIIKKSGSDQLKKTPESDHWMFKTQDLDLWMINTPDCDHTMIKTPDCDQL